MLPLFYSVSTQFRFVDLNFCSLKHLYIILVSHPIQYSFCSLKSFSEELTKEEVQPDPPESSGKLGVLFKECILTITAVLLFASD